MWPSRNPKQETLTRCKIDTQLHLLAKIGTYKKIAKRSEGRSLICNKNMNYGHIVTTSCNTSIIGAGTSCKKNKSKHIPYGI